MCCRHHSAAISNVARRCLPPPLQAAPYLGTLDPALARELVRKLNSPSFQAPAALLAALARSDPSTGEPVGLMEAGLWRVVGCYVMYRQIGD